LRLFDVRRLDVYGDAGPEINDALIGMNANFLTTVVFARNLLKIEKKNGAGGGLKFPM